MPLDPSKLTTPLGELFNDPRAFPASTDAAGTLWADIYAGYAAAAQAAPAGAGPITLPLGPDLDAAKGVLASALRDMFDSAQGAGSGYLAKLDPVMANAFAAFWKNVGFELPGAATGKVTDTAAGELIAPLTEFFTKGNEEPRPSADEQAGRLATALHAWTRKVKVLNTPNSGQPVDATLV